MKNRLAFVIVASLLLVPLFLGCSSTAGGEGFAIYLTRDNIPPSQMEALSHVDLADQPVISINDIVEYNWATHEIELTPDAYQRLDAMHFPTNGTSFLVCVDHYPVYWGAFWSSYSSQSFNGVTIITSPFFHESEGAPNTIQISLGYPSPSFHQGVDPRSNQQIMDSLVKTGKLVST
jgi:hypothetical protein